MKVQGNNRTSCPFKQCVRLYSTVNLLKSSSGIELTGGGGRVGHGKMRPEFTPADLSTTSHKRLNCLWWSRTIFSEPEPAHCYAGC